MRRALRLLALSSAGAILLAAGCRRLENELPGQWRGTTQVAANVSPEVKALTKALGEPTLLIRPDRTYRLDVGPIPIEGDWTFTSTTLSLAPRTVGGKSLVKLAKDRDAADKLSRPTELLISADGENLLADSPNGRTTFRKITE